MVSGVVGAGGESSFDKDMLFLVFSVQGFTSGILKEWPRERTLVHVGVHVIERLKQLKSFFFSSGFTGVHFRNVNGGFISAM